MGRGSGGGNLSCCCCCCVGGGKGSRKKMGWGRRLGEVKRHQHGGKQQQSFTSGSVGWCSEPKAGIKCSGHELNLSVNVT